MNSDGSSAGRRIRPAKRGVRVVGNGPLGSEIAGGCASSWSRRVDVLGRSSIGSMLDGSVDSQFTSSCSQFRFRTRRGRDPIVPSGKGEPLISSGYLYKF